MTDAPVPGPPALLLYGSCVSRDTYQHALRDEAVLRRYVARQSLVSAYGPPAAGLEPPADALPHRFQERTLREDLASSLPGVLEAELPRVRAVVWDLVDERLGVYRRPDGAYVTRSLELIASGLEPVVAADAAYLPYGTPEHLAAWADALGRFAAQVAATGVPLVALDVPWAEQDESGAATPSSFGVTAAAANAATRPYVEMLVAAPGVRVVHVDPRDVRADATHRWGPAPFHYAGSTYDVVADGIRRALGPGGPGAQPPADGA